MNIVFAIRQQYPKANSQKDFRVEDRGEGQFIADWFLDAPRPTEAQLNEWWKEYTRSEKIRELKTISGKEIMSPFTSASTGHIYEFEEHDQANFTQQMLLLVSNPAITELTWKTVDAGVITHTREQFFAVVGDADLHKRGILNKYWTKEVQVKEATTTEAIEAISWDENTTTT